MTRSALAPLLLVGVDVGELRQRLQRLQFLGPSSYSSCRSVVLQRVLVLRVALAPADADVLHRLQEQLAPGDLGQLLPQARDDLCRRVSVALGRAASATTNMKPELVCAAAGEADDVSHRRIRRAGSSANCCSFLLHCLERDALVGLDAADDPAGVLLREKPLGDHRIQHDVERDRSRSARTITSAGAAPASERAAVQRRGSTVNQRSLSR